MHGRLAPPWHCCIANEGYRQGRKRLQIPRNPARMHVQGEEPRRAFEQGLLCLYFQNMENPEFAEFLRKAGPYSDQDKLREGATSRIGFASPTIGDVVQARASTRVDSSDSPVRYGQWSIG